MPPRVSRRAVQFLGLVERRHTSRLQGAGVTSLHQLQRRPNDKMLPDGLTDRDAELIQNKGLLEDGRSLLDLVGRQPAAVEVSGRISLTRRR